MQNIYRITFWVISYVEVNNLIFFFSLFFLVFFFLLHSLFQFRWCMEFDIYIYICINFWLLLTYGIFFFDSQNTLAVNDYCWTGILFLFKLSLFTLWNQWSEQNWRLFCIFIYLFLLPLNPTGSFIHHDWQLNVIV